MPSPRSREALRRAGLLAVSLLLCLAIVEAYGRHVMWGENRPNLTIYLEDFELGRRLRPGFQGDHYGSHVEINSHGMRDREYAHAKPEQSTRILALGDSWTFGVGMRTEETWPRRLEVALGAPDRNIQVMNTGVSGYETHQEAIYYQELTTFDHDLVLVGIYPVNDVHDKHSDYALNKAIHDFSPLLYDVYQYPKHHLYITHLYANWRRARKRRLRAEFYTQPHAAQTTAAVRAPPRPERAALGTFAREKDDWTRHYTPSSPGWRAMRDALASIGDTAHAQRVPGVAILFPDLRDLERHRLYSHPRTEPMIREAAREAGLELVDLLDDFLPYVGREEEVSGKPGSTHPNARGYQLIGRAVARELAARGLVPASPEQAQVHRGDRT